MANRPPDPWHPPENGFPRGVYIGERQGGPPADEADHFYQCAVCGGWVDKRDLGAVFDHEPGGSHPASDKAQ